MLPASHSAQNVHSGGLVLHPPPRSRSNANLAASAGPPGGTSSNGNGNVPNDGLHGLHNGTSSSPSFMRSASAGPGHPSPVPHHGFVRSASEMPPSPSLRMPASSVANSPSNGLLPRPQRSGSGSHTPTQPTFAHNAPPPHYPASISHFGLYDSRLVANTINKIESTSTAGTLVSAASGASSVTGIAGPAGSYGPENDAWTAVCIRTLPLFNGEGQRGYIEDLNDLVTLHIKRTAERLGKSGTAINALSSDLTDLLAMGMLTLNAKLVDLSDDRLLVRITEVWNFFFIGCLPYIEGIFLPLRTDDIVRGIVGNPGNNNGRSVSFSSSTGRDVIENIDIRRLALRAFRDHLVLPIVDRLAILFSAQPSPSAAHPAEPSSRPGSIMNVSASTRTASARRLQMVNILVSVQSNDERQAAAEALGHALRVGIDKQPASYAASSTPVNFANGLYGTAMYSAARAASESGRESERKGRRKGRDMKPPPSRDGFDHPKRRVDPFEDGRSEQGSRASDRSRRPTMDTEDERRYLNQAQRNDHEKVPSPLTSRDVPEVAVID